MAVTPVEVRRAAMDMLARREHSGRELHTKLLRKFPSAEGMIDEEIGRLAAEGLQSDVRLAEAFVRARASRGQGPMKIRAELRGKGVTGEVIGFAFSESDVDWFGLAAEVLQKRFGDAPVQDHREKSRRSRFLQQRGFTFDHISEVI